jgi:YrbI family 3-deoxy-D-manno-octulosonate 8-phosphate phosphatase
MHIKNNINNGSLFLDKIDAFVFDFDGVLTDNLVRVDQDGKESVSCSRSDGLAFDVFHKINKPVYILSTEKNPVVTARANKLRVPVLQGVGDKSEAIKKLANQKNFKLENIFYVGNDLNDYCIMQLCGYTACPADSHPVIKQLSTYLLKSNGGNGVVRELLESVIGLDFVQILFTQEGR